MTIQLDLQPLKDSGPILADQQALRQSMDRDGHLFLRVLVSKTEIDAGYADMAAICRKHG